MLLHQGVPVPYRRNTAEQEGPRSSYLGLLALKTIPLCAFGAKDLKLLGLSGLAFTPSLHNSRVQGACNKFPKMRAPMHMNTASSTCRGPLGSMMRCSLKAAVPTFGLGSQKMKYDNLSRNPAQQPPKIHSTLRHPPATFLEEPARLMLALRGCSNNGLGLLSLFPQSDLPKSRTLHPSRAPLTSKGMASSTDRPGTGYLAAALSLHSLVNCRAVK